jgi:hypothetical protein
VRASAVRASAVRTDPPRSIGPHPCDLSIDVGIVKMISIEY